MKLTQEEIAVLRLVRTPGIGPSTYHKLIKKCGNATEAIYQLPQRVPNKKANKYKIPAEKDLIPEINAMRDYGAQYIFYGSADYPEALAHIPDAPPVLTIRGQKALLKTQQIAIVGNRNASSAGQTFTQELAGELCLHGLTITSGLARGIDTAAHTGALNSQGNTIAVIAGGIDNIYPPENKALYQRIAEQGLIVAENPIETTPMHTHFPRRNRIIAGLSVAVVVTESSRHSGSLITTTYAGEYGRDVFAVPGSPRDNRAAGPNHLIKQGAHVLLSSEDITSMLPQLTSHRRPNCTVHYTRETQGDFFNAPPTAAHTHTAPPYADTNIDNDDDNNPSTASPLKTLLSSQPVEIDELMRQSGLPETALMLELSEMELLGEIQRHPDGRVSRL